MCQTSSIEEASGFDYLDAIEQLRAEGKDVSCLIPQPKEDSITESAELTFNTKP